MLRCQWLLRGRGCWCTVGEQLLVNDVELFEDLGLVELHIHTTGTRHGRRGRRRGDEGKEEERADGRATARQRDSEKEWELWGECDVQLSAGRMSLCGGE